MNSVVGSETVVDSVWFLSFFLSFLFLFIVLLPTLQIKMVPAPSAKSTKHFGVSIYYSLSVFMVRIPVSFRYFLSFLWIFF